MPALTAEFRFNPQTKTSEVVYHMIGEGPKDLAMLAGMVQGLSEFLAGKAMEETRKDLRFPADPIAQANVYQRLFNLSEKATDTVVAELCQKELDLQNQVEAKLAEALTPSCCGMKMKGPGGNIIPNSYHCHVCHKSILNLKEGK